MDMRLSFFLSTADLSTVKSVYHQEEGLVVTMVPDNKLAYVFDFSASNKITIPKIFIQDKHQKRVSKNPFELILRLPINIIQFNQSVIDLCKKHEFNKNSLINVLNRKGSYSKIS